jgi:hypothetical protein
VLAAPQVRFIVSGEIIYDGRELPAHSCLYIPEHVATEHLETRQGAELLVMTLPMYVASVWQQGRTTAAVTA